MNFDDFHEELKNSNVSTERLLEIVKMPGLDHGVLQLVHLHNNCSSEIIELYLSDSLDLNSDTYGPDDQRFQFSFILESAACTTEIIESIWNLMLEDYGPGFDLFDYYAAEILAMARNPLINESVVSGIIENVIEENLESLGLELRDVLINLINCLLSNPVVLKVEKEKLKIFLEE